jgi:hypothetical protein
VRAVRPRARTLVQRSLDGLLVEAGDQLVTAWRELLALGEAKREHRVVLGT